MSDDFKTFPMTRQARRSLTEPTPVKGHEIYPRGPHGHATGAIITNPVVLKRIGQKFEDIYPHLNGQKKNERE
jgi:hypothetical protein